MYFSTSDLYHKSDLTPDTAWSAKTKKPDGLDCQDGTKYDQRKIKVNVMMPKDILLYSKIGEYPNCHQRGFIQKLMETDPETQSQALGSALGEFCG